MISFKADRKNESKMKGHSDGILARKGQNGHKTIKLIFGVQFELIWVHPPAAISSPRSRSRQGIALSQFSLKPWLQDKEVK